MHYCDHALSVVRRPNKTWQEARSQRPLPSLCFSGRSEKQDGRPGLWLAETFRLLFWNGWTEFNKTWQEARSQRRLPSLCFSGGSEKTRWPPWPLIGWDIFDFSSETAERNSTKLERKHDLNVLYQVLVFWADRKNKIATMGLIGWDIFDFSSETAERNSTKLDRKQGLKSSTKFVFFRLIRKTRWLPWPIPQKGGTLYSGARYVALWASCL